MNGFWLFSILQTMTWDCQKEYSFAKDEDLTVQLIALPNQRWGQGHKSLQDEYDSSLHPNLVILYSLRQPLQGGLNAKPIKMTLTTVDDWLYYASDRGSTSIHTKTQMNVYALYLGARPRRRWMWTRFNRPSTWSHPSMRTDEWKGIEARLITRWVKPELGGKLSHWH